MGGLVTAAALFRIWIGWLGWVCGFVWICCFPVAWVVVAVYLLVCGFAWFACSVFGFFGFW